MKKIAFLSYDMNVGGAERMISVLVNQFVRAETTVDLVLVNRQGEFLKDVSPKARIISFDKPHLRAAIPALIRYFASEKPDVVISSLTHLNLAAVICRILSRSNAKLILIEHSTISQNNLALNLKERLITRAAHLLYPRADKIVVVSNGSAKDLIQTIKIDPNLIQPIYNPLDLQLIREHGNETPDHRWLTDKQMPVLLAIGRLMPAKNFPFLLSAFSEVVKQRACRLIILGEGAERINLEKQIADLGLEEMVDLPGIKTNPYAFLTHSDMLLCTSNYEGFNLTIAEALACGTPVVSVDCPHGPAEILENGRWGKLTPLGDQQAFTDAILTTLDTPISADGRLALQQRSEAFSADEIFRQYQELIHSLKK